MPQKSIKFLLMKHKRMNTFHPDNTDYLDIQRTFDKNPYHGLIQKLRSQKIRKKTLTCINNWLKDWKRRVRVHSQFRKKISVQVYSHAFGSCTAQCISK